MDDDLTNIAKDIRRKIIEMAYKAEAHHIGSCLSCVEILTILYGRILRPQDRFILSAGHKAFALYATLEHFRAVKFNLDKVCHHPKRSDLIEVTTGSLGHGLSIGCGMALANPLRDVYVLMSDGELNEGSVWEAAMFAGHHNLVNLKIIIDQNGWQATERTRRVLLTNYHEMWHGAGWFPLILRGHNFRSLEKINEGYFEPTAFFAETVKGKGISFMENNNDWHYETLNEHFYKKAMEELE